MRLDKTRQDQLKLDDRKEKILNEMRWNGINRIDNREEETRWEKIGQGENRRQRRR